MFGLLGLLSRLRLGRGEMDLARAANQQYLFPVAGFILGGIVAIVAFIAYQLLGFRLDSMLTALLVVASLYFLTGLIHLEGLGDFGDGLVASGTRERKRGAMKDVSLGAGGTFFMLMAVLALLILVSELFGRSSSFQFPYWSQIPLIWGLVLAEISAKLAMVTSMTIGPSSHEGMGRIFVSSASAWKLTIAIALGVLIAFIFFGPSSLIVLSGLVAGAIVAIVARSHFGGVAGDSFGAANELGRILALFVWVIIA